MYVRCENTLPVECAAVRHVASSCYALLDYPTPGFVFELQTDTVRLVKVSSIAVLQVYLVLYTLTNRDDITKTQESNILLKCRIWVLKNLPDC